MNCQCSHTNFYVFARPFDGFWSDSGLEYASSLDEQSCRASALATGRARRLTLARLRRLNPKLRDVVISLLFRLPTTLSSATVKCQITTFHLPCKLFIALLFFFCSHDSLVYVMVKLRMIDCFAEARSELLCGPVGW